MGRTLDTDDLVDAAEVADVLGLSSRTAISVYRRRYADFPQPVLRRGTCVLWSRREVERWARDTGRIQ